jgi:hypothetical protein
MRQAHSGVPPNPFVFKGLTLMSGGEREREGQTGRRPLTPMESTTYKPIVLRSAGWYTGASPFDRSKGAGTKVLVPSNPVLLGLW